MIPAMPDYLTGGNGVAEALKRQRGVLLVSRGSGRAASLAELAAKHGVKVRRVSDDELTRLVSGEHRGFALEIQGGVSKKNVRSLEDLWERTGENSLVILLDGITDPRNLGAVLRAADQFAADAVVVPKRRSAGGDLDAMSRASSGAMEWVPLVETTNLSRALAAFRDHGYWIWGADMAGEEAPKVNLTGRTVLVMGREGEGLHRLVREGCDGLIRIPTGGRLDSLNVATAAGILLYEARRQQGFTY